MTRKISFFIQKNTTFAITVKVAFQQSFRPKAKASLTPASLKHTATKPLFNMTYLPPPYM